MRTTPLLRALRGLAVLAILSGGFLVAAPAGAEPVVTFEVCEEPTPEPTATPEPPTSEPTPEPPPPPEPTSSPEACTPPEGSVVEGDVVVAFRVDVDGLDDLREVSLSIESRTEGVPSPANPVRVWREDEANPGRFEYLWDTRTIPEHNGTFDLVVRAVTEHAVDGRQEASGDHKDLHVDNPPQTPEKPVVSNVTDAGVNVEWAPAPEPDILHYTLYRARTDAGDQEPDDGAFKAVVLTEKTSVLDEVSTDGAYWYRIATTRHSVVTPDEGISSDLSARSDEPGVYVAPVPTPEPEPPADDGGGGDGGSPATRPRLTPRPLPRAQRSGPPQPSDAPFSDVLPYDVPEDGSGSGGADLAQGGEDREPGDGQGALPAVAIGTFLVSAALALGRMPTT